MGSWAEIVVIGDMHGLWSPRDVEFLRQRGHAHTLFVGDLGDENVGLVREIASLDVPKAVILGNHDAWQSFSNKCPTTKLEQSIEALGGDHLAYAVRDLPDAEVSIVGARPFSWGGMDIRSPEVYGQFYGVESPEDSTDRIVEAAAEAEYDDLLILAHNGPHGLSGQPNAIYGKDFGRRPGGDWGDRDLAAAIGRIELTKKRVRAVVAGHMHHKLHPQVGGFRSRFARRAEVSYLNPAVVPRIRRTPSGDELRHYMVMNWRGGELGTVEEIWVDANGDVREKFTPRFRELQAR